MHGAENASTARTLAVDSSMRVTAAPLLLALVSCARPSGGGAAQPEAIRSTKGVDSHPADASDTPSCQHQRVCGTLGDTCERAGLTCTCAPLCSGVDWGDQEPSNSWACSRVDPKCPETVPQEGQRCRPKGLSCAYGHCGGAGARCEKGKWVVTHHPPPA